MPEDAKGVLGGVQEELEALRSAILTNDLSGLEGHTAVLKQKLDRLRSAAKEPDTDFVRQMRVLHHQVRCVRAFLNQALRTTHALLALYRSYGGIFAELR